MPVNAAPEELSTLVGDVFAALSRCQASLPEKERWRIAGAIHQESRRHGYDPLFIMALIQVESGCSPTARGEQGAVGLTQLKPSTARAMAREVGLPWAGGETLIHPVLNVQLGLAYLSKLERQFQDPYLAMVAFNKGPARVAGMTRQRARGAKYVRRVLSRYENLTDEASTAEEM
jgi:soluble lytic murein transglycosylase-like protein